MIEKVVFDLGLKGMSRNSGGEIGKSGKQKNIPNMEKSYEQRHNYFNAEYLFGTSYSHWYT